MGRPIHHIADPSYTRTYSNEVNGNTLTSRVVMVSYCYSPPVRASRTNAIKETAYD